jgi:hypothetical protein
MHFLPDTSEQDGLGERYWPDGFKSVIRREVEAAIRAELNEESLGHVYERKFRERFPTLHVFLDRVATLVAIGAETGADDAFEAIYQSFLTESPLPRIHAYAAYFWPSIFSEEMKESIRKAVTETYAQEEGFQYAYRAGYQRTFEDYSRFIREVARLMLAGVIKGADDMLGKVYRSFLARRDLPLGRRNPKRLKEW